MEALVDGTECEPKAFEEEKMEEIKEEMKDEGNKGGFDDESLVNLVKEYRVIWDSSSKGYRDKEMRKDAWSDISAALNKDVDVIKRRWKNLRDGMVRCLKKLDHSQHPGSGYLKTPMCRLFNELLFLRDCVTVTNTSMNLSDTEADFATPSTPQVDCPPRKRARSSANKQATQETNAEKTEQLDVYLTTEALLNGLDKPDVASSDWLFCRSLVGILEKMPSKNNRKARIEILQVLMKYEFHEDEEGGVVVGLGAGEGIEVGEDQEGLE